jgi:hypothetical protein
MAELLAEFSPVGDHEAASNGAPQADNAHHRLVHHAMKNQPTNAANRRSRRALSSDALRDARTIDEEINAFKWKLWHGQVDRAISALCRVVSDINHPGQNGDLSATRFHSLGHELLTYIRSNRAALFDYGARYRSGPRVVGGISGQFSGRKSNGQEPENALVAERRSSHAAG